MVGVCDLESIIYLINLLKFELNCIVMDSRSIHLGVIDSISSREFEDYFELSRKCIARGEICELR